MDFESPGVFDTADPWERWRLHQHAKGRLPKVRGEGPRERGGDPLSDPAVGPSAPQQAGPPPPRDTPRDAA